MPDIVQVLLQFINIINLLDPLVTHLDHFPYTSWHSATSS